MNTVFEKIDFEKPLGQQLKEAGKIIRQGGLVAFPTETVYGLGADAFNEIAVDKIFAAKGRPRDNPLIVHIADVSEYEKYHDIEDKELYYKLIHAFVPGPITIVAKSKPCIPAFLNKGLNTVALRLPENPVAKELIKAAGTPIAAPSANISGSPSPTCARHVAEDMDGKIDMIIDGGSCNVGVESTVVYISQGVPAKLKLLRPGGITLEMLKEITENIEVDPAVIGKPTVDKPMSPGMKYRHYSPATPTFGVRGEQSKVLSFLKAKQDEDCAILCFDEDLEVLSDKNLFLLGSRGDSRAHAARVFYGLRELDRLGKKAIYVHIPTAKGLDSAVFNRLLKACGHNITDVE